MKPHRRTGRTDGTQEISIGVKYMSRLFALLSIMAVAQPAAAQMAKPSPAQDTSNVHARKSLHAVRIAGAAPEVDGRLTEAVWTMAPAGTDFVQRQPNPGQPSSQ